MTFHVLQVTPDDEDKGIWYDFPTFHLAEVFASRKAMEDMERGGVDTFAVLDQDYNVVEGDPS